MQTISKMLEIHFTCCKNIKCVPEAKSNRKEKAKKSNQNFCGCLFNISFNFLFSFHSFIHSFVLLGENRRGREGRRVENLLRGSIKQCLDSCVSQLARPRCQSLNKKSLKGILFSCFVFSFCSMVIMMSLWQLASYNINYDYDCLLILFFL